MELVLAAFLGRRIALALLGHAVHQHRTVVGAVAQVAQDRQQVVQVVAVDRAHVVEAELLEQGAAGHHAAGVFLGPPGRRSPSAWAARGHLLGRPRAGPVGLRRQQPREIGAHGADRRRDRHVVVVQDNDQPRAHGAGVVHRLVGHARGHRAVTDHGDDIVVARPSDRGPPQTPGPPRSRSKNAPRRRGRTRSRRAW